MVDSKRKRYQSPEPPPSSFSTSTLRWCTPRGAHSGLDHIHNSLRPWMSAAPKIARCVVQEADDCGDGDGISSSSYAYSTTSPAWPLLPGVFQAALPHQVLMENVQRSTLKNADASLQLIAPRCQKAPWCDSLSQAG